MTENTFELFVTCSQNLEEVLAEELYSLGFDRIHLGYRGVYVTASDLNAVYKINYLSRIGGRVLLPLTRFKCFDSDSLYRVASKIHWLDYIPKNKTFAIDANVTHRKIRNSLFAAQIVKDAICDQFRDRIGSRPNVDTKAPDVQLNLFVHDEKAILSFDTSGVPLHKRGYRLESVEAPMQEALAAAVLRLTQYNGEEKLFDPCCGSGTILTEAALMVTNTPPGFLRNKWGFMHLPNFNQQDWLSVKNAADQLKKPLKKGMISGIDINKNAVRISKSNLRACGFHQEIEVTAADFREYTPEVLPNLVITNPPHGNRLGDIDTLRPLYRSLGEFLKEKLAKPARAFIYTGSLELAKETGLASKKRYVLDGGGVEARLLEFDLY